MKIAKSKVEKKIDSYNDRVQNINKIPQQVHWYQPIIEKAFTDHFKFVKKVTYFQKRLIK